MGVTQFLQPTAPVHHCRSQSTEGGRRVGLSTSGRPQGPRPPTSLPRPDCWGILGDGDRRPHRMETPKIICIYGKNHMYLWQESRVSMPGKCWFSACYQILRDGDRRPHPIDAGFELVCRQVVVWCGKSGDLVVATKYLAMATTGRSL